MMPPTSIDGTDITGATIDGTDVQEITVDGQTVFSAGPFIPDSGVLRYTFDTSDTSGSTSIDFWGSNNATITGASTGQTGVSTTYDSGESYSFDGVNDTVVSDSTIPTSIAGDTSKTFSLWFYQTDYSTTQGIFLIGLAFGGDGKKFGLFRNAGADGGLTRWGEGADFDHKFDTLTNLNTAYHVVAVYDSGAGESRIYLNGSKDATDKSMTLDTDQTDVEISTDKKFTDYFDGRIDDIRLYDKALSDNEVSNLYNTGSIN